MVFDTIENFENHISNLKDFDFSDLSKKFEISSPMEIFLSYSFIKFLLIDHKLSNTIDSIYQLFDQQTDLLHYSTVIWEFITNNNFDQIYLKIEFNDFENDPYGDFLQDLLNFEKKKTLASNYTMNSTSLISATLMPKLEECKVTIKSICDHFCGSGNLVIAYLLLNKKTPPETIRINDVMPTAVLLAFCRIKSFDSNLNIISSIKDGFYVTGTFDLVLINPPYTRSHRISKTTSPFIKQLEVKLASIDKIYNTSSRTGHAGLHFWSLVGLDAILSNNSFAFIVLPRAIINAVYSQSFKLHLMDNYHQFSLYEYKNQKAFSRSSELKEIIFVLSKVKAEIFDNKEIKFFSIDDQKKSTKLINSINSNMLRDEWNWEKYFLNREIIRLSNLIISDLDLTNISTIHSELKRGIELYGPDIFFFPNRIWKTKDSGNKIQISDNKSKFLISSNKFQRILRKPQLYKNGIIPDINHFVIKLDQELDKEEHKFVERIKSSATSAINKFGKDWYQHPRLQIQTKEPSGQIFIIDKLDLSSTPTLAYYTPKKEICTKNFYVLNIENNDQELVKFLAAWLNSTIYLLLYLTHRREIGLTYGRLQIIDYNKHNLFPRLLDINKNSKFQKVLKNFDTLTNIDLPPLTDQLWLKERIDLDDSILSYFDQNIDAKLIHNSIQTLFQHRFDLSVNFT